MAPETGLSRGPEAVAGHDPPPAQRSPSPQCPRVQQPCVEVWKVPDSQHPEGGKEERRLRGEAPRLGLLRGQTGPGPSHQCAALPPPPHRGGWWAESPPGSKLGIWKSQLRGSHQGSDFNSRAPGFRQNPVPPFNSGPVGFEDAASQSVCSMLVSEGVATSASPDHFSSVAVRLHQGGLFEDWKETPSPVLGAHPSLPAAQQPEERQGVHRAHGIETA